jgi:moderate conductance mechanosensitive channel
VQRVLRRIGNWRPSLTFSIRSLLNVALVGLLATTLLTAWMPTAVGTSPLLKLWQQQLQQPSRKVQRLGNVEAAPVYFEGRPLLTLASPTVWDRTEVGSQIPVEVRAKQVESNLERVIEGSFIHGKRDGILTNFDPKTLQVSVASLNDVPVIIAGDSYHTQPQKLVTVTYIDADYSGQAAQALAEQWRSLIYQNLYAALMDRSPDALSPRGKLGESLLVLVLTVAASLVIWLLQWPLYRQNRQLRLQQAALAAEILPDRDEAPLSSRSQANREQELMDLQTAFVETFEQRQQIQRQRNDAGFCRWLLAWVQVAIWLIGLSTAFTLFPWTKQYVPHILGTPTALLLIWFVTGWVNQLAGSLLSGLAHTWIKFSTSPTLAPQRDSLRVFTLLTALKPLKTGLIYSTGGVAALVYLGLPLSLVLTIAAIVGLALLLICQGFIKDWMAGLLILAEDQYAVGDVIRTKNYTGLVERMNPRLTQLWDVEGRLISLANSSIAQVENLTRSWLQRQQRDSGPNSRTNRLVVTSSNPFSGVNGADPFNGVDPFGSDSNEPTVN